MGCFRVAIVFVLSTQFVACANLDSIYRRTAVHRRYSGTSVDMLFVDAKQRAIAIGSPTGGPLEVCAEPSPDALSAYAASISGEGQSEAVKAAIKAAFGESAGSFGLRTQSITLLRDYMYRICEAYRNGKYDSHQVAVIHRRFQTVMVGLLAIEQLTGAVVASQVGLVASASVGSNAEQIVTLTNKLDDATTAKGTAEQNLRTASDAATKAATALKDAKAKEQKLKDEATTPEKKATLEKDIEALGIPKLAEDKGKADKDEEAKKQALKTAEERVANVNRAIKAIESGNLATTGTTEFTPAQMRAMPTDPSSVAAISNAVVKIVELTQITRFVSDECLVALRGDEPASADFRAYCRTLLDDIGNAYAQRGKREEAINSLIVAYIRAGQLEKAGSLLRAVSSAESSPTSSAESGRILKLPPEFADQFREMQRDVPMVPPLLPPP